MTSDDRAIPSTIATDFTSVDDTVVTLPQIITSPVQSLSLTGRLSPHSPGALPRSSLDVPPSPTHTGDETSIITAPLSSTLTSCSSVNLTTLTSLSELHNSSISHGRNTHQRKGENATFPPISNATEADHHSGPQEHVDLDTDTDPTPFRFRSNDLDGLPDPKSLGTLEDFGSVEGLLEGLGTTSSHLFQNAAGFKIAGGQFVSGDVHYHAIDVDALGPNRRQLFLPTTQPARTANETSISTSLDATSEYAESEIYSGQLLRRKRGFPLYVPGPQRNLPEEYQRVGVAIGDVGRVTPEGVFDFFFNIYLHADHPINVDAVPEDFSPLTPYVSRDIIHLDFDPGNYVSSSGIQPSDDDPGSEEFPGSDFHFSCKGTSGAMLALPHGSHLEKLENVEDARRYASQHAESWYRYINGTRGRGLVNGSLYLITGCEKSKSGGMATFQNVEPGNQFRLSFKPTARADTNYKYRFNRGTPALTKNFSVSTQDGCLPNHTTFLHGFTISIGAGIWGRLFGTASICRIGDSQPGKSHSNFIPFGSEGSSFPWSFNFFGGSTTGGKKYAGNSGEEVIFSDLSANSEIFHPGRLINNFLLAQALDAAVAITHDDEWRDILYDDGTERVIHGEHDLLTQICERFVMVEEDGVIFLESAVTSSSVTEPRDDLMSNTAENSTPMNPTLQNHDPPGTPMPEHHRFLRTPDIISETSAASANANVNVVLRPSLSTAANVDPDHLPSPPTSRSVSPAPPINRKAEVGATESNKRSHTVENTTGTTQSPQILTATLVHRPQAGKVSVCRSDAHVEHHVDSPSGLPENVADATGHPQSAISSTIPVRRPKVGKISTRHCETLHAKYHSAGRMLKYSGDARFWATYPPSHKEYRPLADPPPPNSAYHKHGSLISRLELVDALVCFTYSIWNRDYCRRSCSSKTWYTIEAFLGWCKQKWQAEDVVNDAEKAFLGLIWMIEGFIHGRKLAYATAIDSPLERDLGKLMDSSRAAIAAAAANAVASHLSLVTPDSPTAKRGANPGMLPSPPRTVASTSFSGTPSSPDHSTSSAVAPTVTAGMAPSTLPSVLLPLEYRHIAVAPYVASAMESVNVQIGPRLLNELKNETLGIASAAYCMTHSQALLNIPIMARFFPTTFARMVFSTLSPNEEHEPDIEDEEGELFWPTQSSTGEGLGWVCLMGKAMIKEFGRMYNYRGLDGVIPRPPQEGNTTSHDMQA